MADRAGAVVSLQTTMARAAARDRESRWKSHKRGCATCVAAARARNWAGLCDRGLVLSDDLRAARAELDREQQADAQPITGQGMLL
jgi:hypothetical protein